MTDARGNEHAPKGAPDGGRFVSKGGGAGSADSKKTGGGAGGKSTADKLTEATKKYSSDPARDLKAMGYGEKKRPSPMTPEEKIASVHIDFSRDNVLPELNEDSLERMGETNSKEVLLKASTIKRNLSKHMDVSEKILGDIITEALYNPIDVFPANPDNPDYYHIASFVEVEGKDGLKMGLVLLDVDKSKEYFEIGHAYFVDGKGFEKARKKAQKKTEPGSRAVPPITCDSERGA